MLNLYRRHLKTCQHRKKGVAHTGCSCPIWCDGDLNGELFRQSLRLRDWKRAVRKVAELEDPQAPRMKPIRDAVAAFKQNILSLEPSTKRKYGNVLNQFQAYCDRKGFHDLADVKVENLDDYRASRALARTTAQKELETLRQFFAFCRERNWLDDNPAKRIKSSKNIKPGEVTPYTLQEISHIIAACDKFGRTSYERLRGRAMVLLLRHTALRVSDVATLAIDRVKDGQILVRTLKTGGTVRLPVPKELQAALDALPIPRSGPTESRHFFWNGVTSRRAVVGIAERTLAAVFKASEVAGAHAHRFRHTLATQLLGVGGTEQEVADVLGISPNIVRKHYAKWSLARQERIMGLMKSAQGGTPVVHKEESPVVM